MEHKQELDELQEYRRIISGKMQESINEEINKLTEIDSMFKDFQEISINLFNIIDEQEKQIQKLQNSETTQEKEIERQNEYIAKIREKEKYYSGLELDAAKIARLLNDLQQKESELKEKEKELNNQIRIFDKEKNSIIQSKEEAEEKAEQYKAEKNDAVKSRDDAISEKKNLQKELDAKDEKISEYKKEVKKYNNENIKLKDKQEFKEEEIRGLNETISQYEIEIKKIEEDKEWYKNYAIGTDKKVVDFFRGNDRGLRGHYTYLIAPDPFQKSEREKRFPEFNNEFTNKNFISQETRFNNTNSTQSSMTESDTPSKTCN